MVTATQIQRVLSLMSGCIIMAVGGAIGSFNAYSNALKINYNMTQSHIELMSSVMNLGLATAFPAGYFAQMFGPRWTCAASLVMGATVYMLFWGSTLHPAFYLQNFYLMVVYSFMQGFASSFMLMNAAATVVGNYLPEHRGKVMGIVQSFFWLGAATWSGIYGGAFHDTNNIAGYCVMMTSAVAVTNLIGMVTLTSQPPDYSRLTEIEANNLATAQAPRSPEFIASATGFKLFKKLDYHLVVWPFVIGAAIELVYIFNVTTLLRSFKMESHDVLLTVLGPIVGCVSKAQNGFVSDWTLKRLPRVSYIVLSSGFQLLAFILLMVSGNYFVVMVIATILIYNANGANMSLVPSIIGDCFGVEHFGPNWGWAQPGYAILGWILQAMLGKFYDNQIDMRYTTDCYGRNCFTAIISVIIGLNILALCLSTWFWVRQRHRMSRDHREILPNQEREMSSTPKEFSSLSEMNSDPGHFGSGGDYQALSDSEITN